MRKTNIVMLVKDRPELTQQALESLVAHTSPESYNLTIVDDASRLPFFAQRRPPFFAQPPENSCSLRILPSKGITGQARNLGVYWAEKYWDRGDFLYLSDNDVYFTEGWLEKMTGLLHMGSRDHEILLLGGSTHPFHGVNETFVLAVEGGGRLQTKIHTHDAVSGYSHLMRWETWDKYGPHDAHAVGIRQSEDWKFCQDIIKDGGKVGTVWPEVVYATGITDTFGEPAIGADQMRRYPGIIQL